MRKIFYIFISSVALMISSSAKAMFPVTEWIAYVDKVLQGVTDKLAKADFDNMLGNNEAQQKAQNPNAQKKVVTENPSALPISEFPPYADASLKAELSKKEPSIAEVSKIIRETLTYKSDTITVGGDQSKRTKTDSAEVTDNTLEKQQFQSIMTYEAARALARRTQDLAANLEKDFEEIDRIATSSSTTGSLHKTVSLIIFKTHQQLNEIATLRNSYFEIMAIDTILGNEIKEEKSMIDNLKDAANSLVN
ncbi:MAG: hypothetical protein E7014_04965 [Alphaproteobacteria bacterium]|nr:hypothetical protein [Alphaproteobacteria bacterium]